MSSSKITLISPPDIYENSNPSLLFVHLSEEDQDRVGKWLHDKDLDHDVNFYVYNGEQDVKWFLWALNVSKHKYIDLDGINEITQTLCGYILTKSDVSYKTKNENLASVCRYINVNRITDIEQFLERVFSGQTRTSSV